MINSNFYPTKIRKSKLYIEATLKDMEENYHVKVKKGFMKKLIFSIKKLFSK